jgi:hypothetical protein
MNVIFVVMGRPGDALKKALVRELGAVDTDGIVDTGPAI